MEGTISDDTTMKFHYFDAVIVDDKYVSAHVAYISKEDGFKVCLLNVVDGEQCPDIAHAQLPANNFGAYKEGDEKLAKLKAQTTLCVHTESKVLTTLEPKPDNQ